MGRSAQTADGKGPVATGSKKGTPVTEPTGPRNAMGRAPSKKAPAAQEGPAKKLAPSSGKS